MKKKNFRKSLVLGIAAIFIGIGVIPTTAIIQEHNIEAKNIIEAENTYDDNYLNSLGSLEVFWDRYWLVSWTFIYPVDLYTTYYFPEQNGDLIANFSVNCTTYARSSDLVIPRCSFFKIAIHDGKTKWSRIIYDKIIWIRDVDTDTPNFCMVLENISIPLYGEDNRTLYVEYFCGGHLFNPSFLEFPFFSKNDGTLIVVQKLK